MMTKTLFRNTRETKCSLMNILRQAKVTVNKLQFRDCREFLLQMRGTFSRPVSPSHKFNKVIMYSTHTTTQEEHRLHASAITIIKL